MTDPTLVNPPDPDIEPGQATYDPRVLGQAEYVPASLPGVSQAAGGASFGGGGIISPSLAALAAGPTGRSARLLPSVSAVPSGFTYGRAGDTRPDPSHSGYWLCTAGGTPGTWVFIGAAGGAADNNRSVRVAYHPLPGGTNVNPFDMVFDGGTTDITAGSADTWWSGGNTLWTPQVSGDYMVCLNVDLTAQSDTAAALAVWVGAVSVRHQSWNHYTNNIGVMSPAISYSGVFANHNITRHFFFSAGNAVEFRLSGQLVSGNFTTPYYKAILDIFYLGPGT